MEGAARRLLRGKGAGAGCGGLRHGLLRADLQPCRGHSPGADEIDRSGLVAPILGHVGDGNFHLIILIRLMNQPISSVRMRWPRR